MDPLTFTQGVEIGIKAVLFGMGSLIPIYIIAKFLWF